MKIFGDIKWVTSPQYIQLVTRVASDIGCSLEVDSIKLVDSKLSAKWAPVIIDNLVAADFTVPETFPISERRHGYLENRTFRYAVIYILGTASPHHSFD